MGWRIAGALFLCCALTARPSAGQQADGAPGDDLLRLFFDCATPGCFDPDYFRREVQFVDWVVQREAADVHVLVTSQPTGGGGRLFTLDFIGLGELEGEDQVLGYASAADATDDEERAGIVEMLKVGLVRYAVRTPVAADLRVSFAGEGAGGAPGGPAATGPGTEQAQVSDPWDYWSFALRANGFVSGEAAFRITNVFGTVQASRVTEAWKIDLRLNFSENVQQFQVSDTAAPDGTRTIRETREDWGLSSTFVRSMGPQWAVGVLTEAGSSTFYNQEARFGFKPGIEYNFVPYSESSRRALTLQYLVGPQHWEYGEVTLFDELSETRFQHSLTARLSLVQPWGRWNTSLTTAQFLHDTSKYNVELFGNFNVRLFRGFSIQLSGSYSWIRDQLYLRKGGASEEEVLLRQRQLETSYRYFTSFGIEYRFGSIFNNIVNPRFGPNSRVFITG